jgi:hypothetical protein
VLSNISANSDEDACAVAKHDFMHNLLYSCRDNAFEMRKEAVWAVSNILYRVSDPAVIEHLVSIDIVNVIVERLQRDSDSGSISSLSL